ncbi:MAG TPA: hypothetical protein VIF43_01470 [Patescibacteria group bacterium]|jgi:hypothetical protein
MPVAELHLDNPEMAERLRSRQDEFAALLGVEPETLRHLEFCDCCHGEDCWWADLTDDVLDWYGLNLADYDESCEYRADVAGAECGPCGGTGFKGGSFDLTVEQWHQLGGQDRSL